MTNYCKGCSSIINKSKKGQRYCNPECHFKYLSNQERELNNNPICKLNLKCANCNNIASTFYSTKPLCKAHYHKHKYG
jgi:hypothetical protein